MKMPRIPCLFLPLALAAQLLLNSATAQEPAAPATEGIAAQPSMAAEPQETRPTVTAPDAPATEAPAEDASEATVTPASEAPPQTPEPTRAKAKVNATPTRSDKTSVTLNEIICTPIGGRKANDEVGPIVMGNMPILQVLDLLRDFSGRIILPGESLPGAKMNFNSGGKLTRLEAIFALENLLALNGVTLRLLDNGFVRAIPASNPDRSAPPTIKEIPENAASEQIYSKTFQLQYFDSNTAASRVRGLLSGSNRSSMINLSESNALIITDSLVNLKRVEEVLSFLDQPPETRQELYSFPVEHGSAWNIRSYFYQLMNSGLNIRLRQSLVYVDNRTNKLLVVTHPTNYDFFKNLVEELDQEVAPFTTTEVIKIRDGNYWSIWQVLQGVVNHQRRQFDARGFRNTQTDNTSGAISRLSGSGERASLEEGSAEETEIISVQAALPGADPEAVMTEGASPEMQFSPYIGLYPDPSNLAYIVYGTPSDIKHVKSLVEKLDIKSAPYVTSQLIEVKNAIASDLRNVVEYSIRTQQSNFARAGLQSGPNRSQSEQSMQPGQQGFEYSPFISTIADNRNNTILVQGTRQDIEQVSELIRKLDIPSAPLTQNEVIYLKHATAETLARVIQNIINYQRWMFTHQRNPKQSGNNGNADSLASPEIGFEFSDYAVVNADRRINALFVYGTRQDIARIKSIIAETDIPVEPITTTRVFALTHTDASQTASIINQVISGQRRSLNQVRSESRDVNNPASRENAAQAEPNAGLVEGNEALQFSNFVSITPDRRSNSLIVYGTAMDIRQVDSLIKQIDIEVEPLTASKVFLLENTQARSLYGVLSSVVRGQERALRQVRSTIREIRNVRPDDPNAALAETTLEALQFSPYITITPNDRNNSIIVYGTPGDIKQLENLIEVSDVEIAPRTQSRTFFIRHADANDVATTITNLIRQQQRVRERESTLTRVFRRGQNGEDAGGEADNAIGMGQEDFAGGGGRRNELITESSSAVYSDLFSFDADLQFSPYVSLVADDRSNAVLAYGTQFDLDQIAKLIEEIDNVLPQVRIEVVIAEVLLTGNQVSGLDSFGISYNVSNPNQTRANTTAPNLPGTTNPAFSSTFSLNDFSLETIFRVAQEDQYVKVLSAPSVTTTHNRQATINVGEARPIITSSSSSLASSDLVTRSTVEYRDIGITLRVRPLVSTAQGFIQMDLEQIVENVIGTQLIDNNQQPIISTRRATSFLSVRDQEVIVMGGLQQVDTRDKDGSVFILGDLPIFGPLFQPKSNEQVVRELIIFIKPYIVEGFDQSELLTEEELDRTAIGQNIEYFLDKGRFAEQEKLIITPPATPEAARKDIAETQAEATQAESIIQKETRAAANAPAQIDAEQPAYNTGQSTLNVTTPASAEPVQAREEPLPRGGPRR